MKDQCQEPVQNGKGYWTANDRRFGTGLNLPRTRHTSEILKTRVRTEPDQNTMYRAYKKVLCQCFVCKIGDLCTPPNSEIICGQNVSTKEVCGMILFFEKKAMLKI